MERRLYRQSRHQVVGLAIAAVTVFAITISDAIGAPDLDTIARPISQSDIPTELRNLPDFVDVQAEVKALGTGGPHRDRSENERLRRYIQNMYERLPAVKTVSVGAQAFGCIPIRLQPSLRGKFVSIDTPPDAGVPGALVLGRVDAVCPTGFVPLVEPQKDTLMQSRTLEEYLSKGHGFRTQQRRRQDRATTVCPRFGEDRCWAEIGAMARVAGLRSRLNIWNPSVSATDNTMSLSQTWILGTIPGPDGAPLGQSLESGWQRYHWWDPQGSVPFVYSTIADWKDGTGCYNLLCDAFVQTTPQVVFALFSPQYYSVRDSRQGELVIEWQRKAANGNWWVKFNGVWIGYYPAERFKGGSLSDPKQPLLVEFGGEIYGWVASNEMGSGAFASAGHGRAAYQRGIALRTPGAKWAPLRARDLLTLHNPSETDSRCYSLQAAFAFPGNTLSSIFFGGAGLRSPACLDASNGKQVVLRVGDVIHLPMPSVQGHAWEVTSDVGPELSVVDDPRSGAGAELQTFAFVGRQAGSRHLCLVLQPRPAAAQRTGDTFCLNVTVKWKAQGF